MTRDSGNPYSTAAAYDDPNYRNVDLNGVPKYNVVNPLIDGEMIAVYPAFPGQSELLTTTNPFETQMGNQYGYGFDLATLNGYSGIYGKGPGFDSVGGGYGTSTPGGLVGAGEWFDPGQAEGGGMQGAADAATQWAQGGGGDGSNFGTEPVTSPPELGKGGFGPGGLSNTPTSNVPPPGSWFALHPEEGLPPGVSPPGGAFHPAAQQTPPLSVVTPPPIEGPKKTSTTTWLAAAAAAAAAYFLLG